MKKYLVTFVDNTGSGPEISVSIILANDSSGAIRNMWAEQGVDPNKEDEYDYFIGNVSELHHSSKLIYI
jgi:hypothetical protein